MLIVTTPKDVLVAGAPAIGFGGVPQGLAPRSGICGLPLFPEGFRALSYLKKRVRKVAPRVAPALFSGNFVVPVEDKLTGEGAESSQPFETNSELSHTQRRRRLLGIQSHCRISP